MIQIDVVSKIGSSRMRKAGKGLESPDFEKREMWVKNDLVKSVLSVFRQDVHMLIWNGTLNWPKRLKSSNKKETADKDRFKGRKPVRKDWCSWKKVAGCKTAGIRRKSASLKKGRKKRNRTESRILLEKMVRGTEERPSPIRR